MSFTLASSIFISSKALYSYQPELSDIYPKQTPPSKERLEGVCYMSTFLLSPC